MNTQTMVFIIEIIGTVAFASSGAMVGIRRGMDIFGVMVMAITTAVGGGIMRDLILGIHPPNTFRNPVYVEASIATALIIFLAIYLRRELLTSSFILYYEQMMSIMDAVGLGAFTVIGVNTAVNAGNGDNRFLLLFVGVITGVGGGVVRDMMAMQVPFIFVKHIYACASLIGAVVCVCLMNYNLTLGMVLGSAVIIVIRLLAAKYRWNLPRIRMKMTD